MFAIIVPGCAPALEESRTQIEKSSSAYVSLNRFAKGQLVAGDGRLLPLRMWLPQDSDGPSKPKAVVVALHGFNDHNTAFDLAAPLWQQQGIATYAYDQRGFGANPDHGIWPGTQSLVQDLGSAIEAARAAHPTVPVYVLGESMGGAVVLATVGGPGAKIARPDGIILVAPAVWARTTMPMYQRVALWAAIRVIPSMRFSGAGFKVQPSDNIPMLRALGRDPLFIKETRIDAIWGLVNLMDDAFNASSKIRCDTLLLYGAHDELVPQKPMRITVKQIHDNDTSRASFAFYPDGWHMLLRDLEYQTVADDVAHWILNRTVPLPSGATERAEIFFK